MREGVALFGLFQKTNRDDPLANAKSIRAWVSRLPANDPVGAVEAMIALLESPAALTPEWKEGGGAVRAAAPGRPEPGSP